MGKRDHRERRHSPGTPEEDVCRTKRAARVWLASRAVGVCSTPRFPITSEARWPHAALASPRLAADSNSVGEVVLTNRRRHPGSVSRAMMSVVMVFWPPVCQLIIIIITDNFCIALFSGVHELTALYNILQHFKSFTNIIHIIMTTNNV